MVRKYDKIRVTSRNIRMAPMFENVYHGNVIGVGEAIGTVSPITGEGIVPSLQSAEILYECLKINESDSVGIRYQKKIRKEFEPEEDNPLLGWRGASRYYDDRCIYIFSHLILYHIYYGI